MICINLITWFLLNYTQLLLQLLIKLLFLLLIIITQIEILCPKFTCIIFIINLESGFILEIIDMHRIRSSSVKYFAYISNFFFRFSFALVSDSAFHQILIFLHLSNSLNGFFNDNILNHKIIVQSKFVFLCSFRMVFSCFKFFEEIKLRILFILSIKRASWHSHWTKRNWRVINFWSETLTSSYFPTTHTILILGWIRTH